VAVLLIAHLVVQHLVLDHEADQTVIFHEDYSRAVADLRQLGIGPPCLIKGEQYIPIAFDAGCASAPDAATALAAGDHIAVLEYSGQYPPRYAARWVRHRLPGTGVLRPTAYLPAR